MLSTSGSWPKSKTERKALNEKDVHGGGSPVYRRTGTGESAKCDSVCLTDHVPKDRPPLTPEQREWQRRATIFSPIALVAILLLVFLNLQSGVAHTIRLVIGIPVIAVLSRGGGSYSATSEMNCLTDSAARGDTLATRADASDRRANRAR